MHSAECAPSLVPSASTESAASSSAIPAPYGRRSCRKPQSPRSRPRSNASALPQGSSRNAAHSTRTSHWRAGKAAAPAKSPPSSTGPAVSRHRRSQSTPSACSKAASPAMALTTRRLRDTRSVDRYSLSRALQIFVEPVDHPLQRILLVLALVEAVPFLRIEHRIDDVALGFERRDHLSRLSLR